jgi:hypothetical protein
VTLRDFRIQRKINKTHRNIQFFNYETAASVAVLYKIESKSDFDTVKDYTQYLINKGMKVYTLGFVIKHTDIGSVYFGQGTNYFFSEKHISKAGKIYEETVSAFIAEQPDILVNVSPSNNFYLEYVFALSKAKFKISGIIDCRYSDLNINCAGNKTIPYFIEQLNHYLNTIKKA